MITSLPVKSIATRKHISSTPKMVSSFRFEVPVLKMPEMIGPIRVLSCHKHEEQAHGKIIADVFSVLATVVYCI